MASENKNGLNGWLRAWIEPQTLVVLILLVIATSITWTTMGAKVDRNTASVDSVAAQLECLDDEYIPRGELIQRLGRIEDRLQEQKQDLKEIKHALGVAG